MGEKTDNQFLSPGYVCKKSAFLGLMYFPICLPQTVAVVVVVMAEHLKRL